MIKNFIKIIILLFCIINSVQADDSYIRRGIDAVLSSSSPEYIEKLYGGYPEGTRLKNITYDHWSSIGKALDLILSWKYIPGFHVIKPQVTGHLKSDGVREYDASRIGTGIQEYAKGDR